MNQERVIQCLFVFDSRVSSKPFWTKPLWLWGTKFNLVLIQRKKRKKSLTLILHFLFLNIEYFVHA